MKEQSKRVSSSLSRSFEGNAPDSTINNNFLQLRFVLLFMFMGKKVSFAYLVQVRKRFPTKETTKEVDEKQE